MNVGNSKRYITTDVLVIGGGMAGMFAAIKVREQGLDVTLTDKAYVGKAGATHYAEGDILHFRKEKGHKVEEWVNMISRRCEYLNNREWDGICLTEAEDRYNDLISWGVRFYEKDNKEYGWNMSVVGAPPSPYEDITMQARKYAPTLRRKARESGVRILDNVMLVELLQQGGKIAGAAGFHVRGGGLYVIKARATIVATGASGVKDETNPTHFWTGDGEAMAYRAGAEITGKEFSGGYTYSRRELKRQQDTNKGNGIFGDVIDASYRYPYALGGGFSGWYNRPTLNAEGSPVITPAWEAHNGRAPLYFDHASIQPKKWEWLEEYFKRIEAAWAQADKVDLDVFRGGKVMVPPSRFSAGSLYAGGTGIWPINTHCASGIPGLYVAGNTCATRGSGATYAGMGFSLNHAMVTGTRAGLAAAEYASKIKDITIDEAELNKVKSIIYAPLERKGGFGPAWVTQIIQSITVPYFYLQVKHGERLQAALTIAEFINCHLVPKLVAKDTHEWRLAQETRNMALNTEMKLRASLFRTESRGDHFREDYPRRDDPTWLVWVKIKDEQGQMKLYKEPIPKEWWPDLTQSYEERYPMALPMEES